MPGSEITHGQVGDHQTWVGHLHGKCPTCCAIDPAPISRNLVFFFLCEIGFAIVICLVSMCLCFSLLLVCNIFILPGHSGLRRQNDFYLFDFYGDVFYILACGLS